MEERWENSFKTHYDFIIERMSPEFGLIDRLFAHGALTNAEKNNIEKKKVVQKKNKLILDCLERNHKLETLIELLGKCDQKHLVKYLENDGNYSDEFDGDWPLTDEVISAIDSNYADLVDLLVVSELIGHLFSTGVINRRQRDFISSKSTPSEKNGALLDILRRSSQRSYWQTIRRLHQTNQSHIAEILATGGAIKRVDVHLKAEESNVNETEKEIATKINNFLSDRSFEESIRIVEHALQMKLIRIKHLPLEALDLILQKTLFGIYIESENLDHNLKEEALVKQLASVDSCWSKRMTNRRFKRTVWTRQLSIDQFKF